MTSHSNSQLQDEFESMLDMHEKEKEVQHNQEGGGSNKRSFHYTTTYNPMIWRPRKTKWHTIPTMNLLDDYSNEDSNNDVTGMKSFIPIKKESGEEEEEGDGTDVVESSPFH